ncbi:uncharacterized protein K489DRAFT_383246 [Dissoconium aciculare CBS 342.82]|uniref:Uncharacterized protein n=1 Tax=Dissoconium aciculare CBS 342.82 TaxID=1314786 RepID=A0A6J3M0K8_9PEZI|nr:uncharacterized protein K489DRAFT_383246 [Dissoconium aciculare CBS 342.82]KAF1820437.1 hypothetical protein K489DRAFT_383246 [Dissoconium aciculare CBS 342.82]
MELRNKRLSLGCSWLALVPEHEPGVQNASKCLSHFQRCRGFIIVIPIQGMAYSILSLWITVII